MTALPPRRSASPAAPRTNLSSAFAWTQAQAGARAFAPSSDPARLLGDGLAVGDAAVILLSSVAAYLLRHGITGFPLEITSTTLLAAALMFNAMRLTRAYRNDATASVGVQMRRAAQAWSVVFVTLVILGYLTKTSDTFSRLWAVGWYALALAGFAVTRLAVASQVRRWRGQGRMARTVAIVDLAGTGDDLARRMLRSAADDIRLVGVFSEQRAAGRKNGLDDLIALARLFRIDEVIVSVTGRLDTAADAVIRRLGIIPTNVRLCPELPPLTVAPREVDLQFGQLVLTIYRRPMVGWSRVAKRIEDLVLATLALVLLGPLMLAVALLIRFDSAGPVLFRQKRLGFNNNVITIFKFRTMLHRSGPETEVPQAQRDDPRITRLGRLLRRTSIDELPQLFNVLRGEMSLVGPRPHALAHNDQYAVLINEYLGRHRVQPGITGWAQVNGFRGETETLDKMQRRVEYDLAYIDSWSLFLDAKILIMTLLYGVFSRNAY